MKYTRTYQLFFALTLLFFSCSKEEEPTIDLNHKLGYIVNEGNFMASNGSITLIDFTDILYAPDYFESVNGFKLGDVVQSIGETDQFYFIIVNNSGKIEVVNKSGFGSEFTIDDLGSPRYFMAINDTLAWVTNFLNQIHRFNPATGEKYNPIDVGGATDQIERIDEEAFAIMPAYPTGFVGVIDISTGEVLDSIPLDLYPSKMVKDKNDKLWVFSSEYLGPSKLYLINTESRSIERTFEFTPDHSLVQLSIDPAGDFIYYGLNNREVYRMAVGASVLPSAPLFSTDSIATMYGLSINSNQDVWVCDAKDFLGSGRVYQFNSAGNLLAIIPSGIGPNGVIFAD